MVIAIIIIYFIGAVITAAVIGLQDPYGIEAEEIFISIVWPISVPIFLILTFYLMCVKCTINMIIKIKKKLKSLTL